MTSTRFFRSDALRESRLCIARSLEERHIWSTSAHSPDAPLHARWRRLHLRPRTESIRQEEKLHAKGSPECTHGACSLVDATGDSRFCAANECGRHGTPNRAQPLQQTTRTHRDDRGTGSAQIEPLLNTARGDTTTVGVRGRSQKERDKGDRTLLWATAQAALRLTCGFQASCRVCWWARECRAVCRLITASLPFKHVVGWAHL